MSHREPLLGKKMITRQKGAPVVLMSMEDFSS